MLVRSAEHLKFLPMASHLEEHGLIKRKNISSMLAQSIFFTEQQTDCRNGCGDLKDFPLAEPVVFKAVYFLYL